MSDFQPVSDGIVMSAGIQHRVTEARSRMNQHRAYFTDWRTACGKEGTDSGAPAGFDGLPSSTVPEGLLSNGRYRRLKGAACKACTAKGWR